MAAVGSHGGSVRQVERVLQMMPIAQQMQLSDWVAICGRAFEHHNSMPVSCDKFPMLQQMDPEDLGQLLQLAVSKGACQQ
jgi:hypothetical protein